MPNRSAAASRRPALTPLQRREFLDAGVVRLPGLIARADAEAMADRLWEALAAQHGLVRDRPETWTIERPAQFRELRRTGAFAGLLSAGVASVLDDFFGEGGWERPAHPGGPLVTFPGCARSWNIPNVAWHLDLERGVMLESRPHYLRIFTFLAPLEPGGGGTLYLAGSHRLVTATMPEIGDRDQISSAAVRAALRRQSPWIDDLCSADDDDRRVARFMQAGTTVQGVELKVGEMTGEAGDVVLMHPATLHAGAPNCRATPRLMLSEYVYASRERASTMKLLRRNLLRLG
jgi:hypothetical protein